MFSSDKKANKWLKENMNKEIINISFDAGDFAIIYEDATKQVKKPKK